MRGQLDGPGRVTRFSHYCDQILKESGEKIESGHSNAQLEHQRTRIANLDLMLEYGCEAWKDYNAVLQDLMAKSQAQLTEQKKQIQEVNWNRKNQQNLVGEKMKRLEANWVGLVSKNYEIERAIVKLEADLKKLKEEQQ